jgi:hypothetical protein
MLYDNASRNVKYKFSVFQYITDFEDLLEELNYVKSIAIIGDGVMCMYADRPLTVKLPIKHVRGYGREQVYKLLMLYNLKSKTLKL